MKIQRSTSLAGWTAVLQSNATYECMPGMFYSAVGVALLFYRPERRLSVSIWGWRRSTNIRLFGPTKLSFQK